MNQDKLLQLQAYLDNELSRSESRKVSDWLAVDDQARAIFDELRGTKALLSGNELEIRLPEAHDFYWSKIEREIQRLDNAPETGGRAVLRNWWLRFAVPVAGAAVLVAVFFTIMKPQVGSSGLAAYSQEIETSLEEANAISFHSQAAGMRVVWIQSQDN